MSLFLRPRQLPAAERALIDAASAAGMVRRIPTGVSGFGDAGESRNWLEVNRRMRLVALRSARLKMLENVAGRRREIAPVLRQMMAEGLTYREMGKRLGISHGAVYRHCQRVGEQIPA